MEKSEVKTYGKTLRNFIKIQNNINAQFNFEAFKWRGRSDYQGLLSFNVLRGLSTFVKETDYDLESLDEESVNTRRNVVESTMAVLEVFVDMYKILNLREKLDIIDALDAHLLEEMRNAEQFEDVVRILCRKSNIDLITSALEFDQLSAFDKVLQTKALDEEDLAILRKIFPLFDVEKSEDSQYEADYNHYNVEVDEEFIASQIGKWQEGYKADIEKSYEEAAKFLECYSHIDSTLYERISKNIEHDESYDKKELLKKFYQSR